MSVNAPIIAPYAEQRQAATQLEREKVGYDDYSTRDDVSLGLARHTTDSPTDLAHSNAKLGQEQRTSKDSGSLSVAPCSAPTVARAQALISAGYYVAPANEYALLTPGVDPRKTPYTADEAARGAHINIYHGAQRNGLILNKIDLDSHDAGQNADKARAAFEQQFPSITRKICWKRSTKSGTGWHGFVLSTKKLPHGRLYDTNGNHIGDILSDDNSRSLDPGDLSLSTLTLTEREHILLFWTVPGAAEDGERWTDRDKEGRRYVFGWKQDKKTKAQLLSFLREYCGKVGYHLANSLESPGNINRSDAAGALMQCLMFNIHKISPNAGYTERCRLAMAYWMASDSFGKAGEKGYSQEKDGCALIAKIVNEDTKKDTKEDRKWKAPFWAKGHIAVTPEPEPESPPTQPSKPAHRPSEQSKRLPKLLKALEAIEPDDFGRRVYTLDRLSACLKTSRRTLQRDMKALRDNGEIVIPVDADGKPSRVITPQIGGNGLPYVILKSQFGRAISTAKPCKTAVESSQFGRAKSTAIDGNSTPKTDDRNIQCTKVEDHQNSSAPTLAPIVAPVASMVVAEPPLGTQGCGDLLPAVADYYAELDCIEGTAKWDESTWDDRTQMRVVWSAGDSVPVQQMMIGDFRAESIEIAPPPIGTPEFRQFVWQWRAARQEDRSKAQRKRFRQNAERLLVRAPASEAQRRWDAVNRRKSTTRRSDHTGQSSLFDLAYA